MTPNRTDHHPRLSPTVRGGLIYLGFLGGSSVFLPFLSVFYAQKGLAGSEIGVLSALAPLMALLVAPVLISAAERRGRQVDLLRLSLAAGAAMTLLFPLAGSFVTLLVVTLLWGLAGCALFSLCDGLASQMAIRHAANFGQMRLWGSIAWAILPGLCGVLWQQVGLVLMFPAGACFYLALAAILPRLIDKPEAPAAGVAIAPPTPVPVVAAAAAAAVAPSAPVDEVRLASLPRRFWLLLACSFFVSACMAMARTFTSVYVSQLGGQVLVGTFVGLGAMSEAPVMLANSRLMARLGGPRTLVLSYALLGGGCLASGMVSDPALLLLTAVVQGVGNGLFVPTTIRLVASWAPPARGSTYQGLLNTGVYGLAPLVAGLLGGAIFDALGVQSVLVASSGFAVLAFLLMLFAQIARPTFARPEPVGSLPG